MENVFDLIPKDKSDNSSIEMLKIIDIHKAEPILGELLEWIQDINWPIAQELINILPRFHSSLIPYIKIVFYSNDDIWKSWTLCLLKGFPAETVKLLAPEIRRIAESPTKGEIEEDTTEYALEVIQKFGL